MTKDYSSFGSMYGVDTPAQGTFCTQPNGAQGVINDRGQCVAQAPLFAPSTMDLYNKNNVPNPQLDLDSRYYETDVVDYIKNVTGVDNSGGVKPGYSGQEQSAILAKAQQEVERAYQLYLGRGADSGGLDYFSQRLKEATMREDAGGIRAVMDDIKNSPEGQAYAASQSSASTESNSTTTSNGALTSEGQCDGNDFVITYSDGTVERLPNYGYCLDGEVLDLPVDHSTSSTVDDNTVDNNTAGNLAAGTFLGQQCSGTTMITLTADGEGGSVQSAAPNSAACGYSAPPPTPPPIDLGDFSTYTSPVSSGIGTVTGNASGAGVGAVTGYSYSPYQMQQVSEINQRSSGQPVDYVKMLQGWLTNSLFQDII
ncbi:MAG: hypothetical protein P8J32_07055 [bacterium]|nr:hypothetical protein [bacterium]